MMHRKIFEGVEPNLETQRRRQVMQAVVECVAEEGFSRTTMRKVAERAGVSTGMLVYYFGSKKEMVNAALTYATRTNVERLDEATGATFGPRRLHILLNGLGSDDADPRLRKFQLEAKAAAANDAELEADQRRIHEESRAKLEKSVRAGMESGEFRRDIDAKLAADLIYGVLVGWETLTGAFSGV